MERHRDVWNRNRVLAEDIMIEVWEKGVDTLESEAFWECRLVRQSEVGVASGYLKVAHPDYVLPHGRQCQLQDNGQPGTKTLYCHGLEDQWLC